MYIFFKASSVFCDSVNSYDYQWTENCYDTILVDQLDRKHNTEEQGLGKYFVSRFMRYQMVENRSVAEQTHEIINLEHALVDAEMKLPEKFLVMSIVNKFLKSWENFGMTLKHQKGRLSLDDLMIAISIEEEHRNQTHKMPIEHQPRANLIVGKQRVNKINSNSKAINKGKTTKNKKPKANRPCWNCGQAITGKIVSMGNSSTAEVLGIGSVDLKFPSGRILSLKRVHHVPTVRRNIISGSRLLHIPLSSSRVAERKNRTFKDMINSLLLTSGLPKYLWGEGLNTACHILNRVPLKHNTTTRFMLWKGRKPSLKYFRVWGCLAKVLVPEHKRKKLGPKTVDAVFLGYVETSYALRFLVIKSEISGIEVNTIVEFRDTVFLEDIFPMKTGITSSVSLDDSLASTSILEHAEKMTNVGVNPNSTSLTHEELDIPKQSKRARVVKDFESDFITYNIEDDPVTFKDAMASSEAKQWKEAVKSEMGSIVFNGTWVLVDNPPGVLLLGGNRLFRYLFSGSSIDYNSVPIALASVYNLSIHQMDVKTTFLYGELREEIYMDQPEGFIAHGNKRKVCKLVKSLYGLKQAPKQWHEKFDKTILVFGFTNKFEMKDMGEADVILGIKLIRPADGLAISQSHYVEKIIEKFGYQNSKIAKTPYDSSIALFKNESGVFDCTTKGTKVPEGHGVTGHTLWQISCCSSGYVFTLEWLFGLLSQLPIVSQPLSPIVVHCDSQTTIAKWFKAEGTIVESKSQKLEFKSMDFWEIVQRYGLGIHHSCLECKVNWVSLLGTLPSYHTTIQLEYEIRLRLSIIYIRLEANISITFQYQISTTVHQEHLLTLSQVLKDGLDCSQLCFTITCLIPARDTKSKCDIRPCALDNILYAAYGRGIGDVTHLSVFLVSLRRLNFGKLDPLKCMAIYGDFQLKVIIT
ncbi:UNVERIFIED_CONTAM: Retrovirus-related Pol polyprotein from transposon TNT 1-94 [Sesamum calycinum]|uniref:Retrovirus-related Pol polyprotein from transposon TNT 1-94 n=1 Tax=Sesamum calycinum TaxID=2727403 RepID=A0AAW2R6M5_9LAMI